MTDFSDDELLARIAARRDQEAFAELYRRYESDVFQLARYMTGSQQAAEDAVQETLLRLWRSANKYREGNARSWILRITAHECLQGLRGGKSKRRHEVATEEIELVESPSHAGEPENRAELHNALRQTVAQLPSADRQIVALYFGANFTQEEIGKEMGVSQRTISERIEQVLGKLRLRLAQAGFAASVTAVASADFLRAVESGPVPSGLFPKIAERLHYKSVRYSVRAAQSVGSTKAMLALAAGFAVVAAAAVVLQPSAKTPASPNAPALVAPTASPVPAAKPAPPQSTLNRVWNFDNGPASDLPAFQGAWAWERSKNNDGQMVIPLDQKDIFTCVLLPQHFTPGHPFEILFKVTARSNSFNGVQGRWINAGEILPASTWHRPHKLQESKSMVRMVIIGRQIVVYTNGLPMVALEFERPWPGDRMALVFGGWTVHAMELREIPVEEISAVERQMNNAFDQATKNPEATLEVQNGAMLDWSKIPEPYR